MIFETLSRCEAFDSSIVDHENIKSFMKRIMELPTLKVSSSVITFCKRLL